MTLVLRPIAEEDWSSVVALEAETYGPSGLSEDPVLLATRIDRTVSFVVATADGIAGYLLALPYPQFRYPDLARVEETIFVSSNLHLHDIAVCRGHRRKGLGQWLVRHLVMAARWQAYETVSLVSVGNSAAFWSAQDFLPHPEITLPAGYGPGASYMSRFLSSGESQPGR